VQLDITAPDVVIASRPPRKRAIDILVTRIGITDDDLFIPDEAGGLDPRPSHQPGLRVHITRTVRKMIRARWGRVINISSVVGLMGNVGLLLVWFNFRMLNFGE